MRRRQLLISRLEVRFLHGSPIKSITYSQREPGKTGGVNFGLTDCTRFSLL
jgi:hypothetical protein